MKTIDFCIPFVSSGLRYAEFLISNLLATATHPERISIFLNVHSQSDFDLIRNSSFNNVVRGIVITPAYTTPLGDSSRGERFSKEKVIGSANHCRAIQTLFSHAKADVVIFSDHDMAFLVAGWDKKIIEILDEHDLCGVGYPNLTFPMSNPEIQLIARNYQKTPNLSFLAITRKCIESYFPEGMSSFHHFLSSGGLHFQIVNTPEMADVLHLPLGTAWLMDSGFEIPFVIQRNKLRYKTFPPAAFNQQPVFSTAEFIQSEQSGFWQQPDFLPDVFYIDSSRGDEPFLAHYRSGTFKSIHKPSNNESFDNFIAAVNDYVAKSIL